SCAVAAWADSAPSAAQSAMTGRMGRLLIMTGSQGCPVLPAARGYGNRPRAAIQNGVSARWRLASGSVTLAVARSLVARLTELAPGGLARRAAGRGRHLAALDLQELEQEPAGDRCRLRKPDHHLLAEAERAARALAGQGLGVGAVVEILAPQRRDRDQP